MADLRRFINPMRTVLDQTPVEVEQRGYLGFSGIGEECRRKMWYGWRWATKKYVERRMMRLWNRGHAEEPLIIADLESMGMVVSGQQDEMVHTLMGRHAMGHSDGSVDNVPHAEKTTHLLECKTMADQYWRACNDKGVERSDWKYYCQMQLYMHYKKLTRALFVATNKNTDRRIYERVTFDYSVAEEMHKKATDIITSELPPRGISDDPAFYKCKQCDHRLTCHGMQVPAMNCRTCKNADVCDDGVWECSLTEKEISEDEQREGCVKYERLF